jgi:hypothetical protein
MATASKTCDVVISHALRATELAKEIADTFRAVALEPAASNEFSFEVDDGAALREAIMESRAFLAVVSSAVLTSWMAFELGAAQVWDKPVFALMSDALAKPPAALKRAVIYNAAGIDKMVRAVKASGERLTSDQRQSLADVYAGMSVRFDEFLLEPAHVDELSERFKLRTHRSVSGERLFSELLRMRKQGEFKKHPHRKIG